MILALACPNMLLRHKLRLDHRGQCPNHTGFLPLLVAITNRVLDFLLIRVPTELSETTYRSHVALSLECGTSSIWPNHILQFEKTMFAHIPNWGSIMYALID